MRTRLHLLTAVAAAALLASCQYLSGRSGDQGGSGREPQGELANQGRDEGARRPASASGRGEPATRPAAREEGAPRSEPTRRVVVVPEGTQLSIELETAVSSGSNRSGDLVLARLAEDVRVGERVVLPEGSEVRGHVTAAVKSGRVKGRARLAVAFDSIEVRDRRHEVETTSIDITAGSTKKRDAALIGGGAGVGAVVKGKKGAGIGALLGGGAVLATKGKDVTLPAGTPVQLKLKRDLRIE